MKKEFTCVVCPNGCLITAEQDADQFIMEGAGCRRGEAYVRQELTDPRRTISTLVKVEGGKSDLVSVRLTAPIPLRLIPEAVQQIHGLKLSSPVHAGDVLITGILGTDSNVIATKTVEEETAS